MAISLPSTVTRIIADVRKNGDKALVEMIRRFDGIRLKPSALLVPLERRRKAYDQVSQPFLKALQVCAKNIRFFAEEEKKHLPKSWMQARGSRKLGQVVRPVDSTGLYIPGGRFPYPSTVLMTAIPARVAGVKRIVMVTPAKNLTPEVLAASVVAGVDELYQIGGAGAIAALAYGTSSIKPVHFIVGPGNSFVTEAKRQVYGTVGIDSLAGPSEVVIWADHTAPIESIANDLLAQAEHDSEAQSTLITTSKNIIDKVRQELKKKSMLGRVIYKLAKSSSEAIGLINNIAPEHLELMIQNPDRILPMIRHAGAIFLGIHSPAAMGDYVAGPSHVLPTHASARFSSGLSVSTFMKRSSVIGFSAKTSEKEDWISALAMAEAEGMVNHAQSLRSRMSSS